ncbi:CopL family metal-binding regulatory protein [Lysobacter sp. A286]
MRNLPLLLRCLIVLAFCLDGSAMAWQKTAMAVGAVHHVHADAHVANDGHGSADHGPDAVAASDCEDTTTTTPSEAAHEDCDCSDGGCACACGFVTLALARRIPLADTLWIGFVPISGDLTTVGKGTSSSLFRPPIG